MKALILESRKEGKVYEKLRYQTCNQEPKNRKAEKTQKKDLNIDNHKGVREAFKTLYQIKIARRIENHLKTEK